MTAVDMLGSGTELADGTGGSGNAVMGPAIGPYRKSRVRHAGGAVLGLTVSVALLVAAGSASAQVEIPETWGGDLWSRPRLTGSWGGLRDELGKKGVVFDADLLLTPQAVAAGGRDTGAEFWGNADYTLNVDTEKLGLWPGGFLRLSAVSGFGRNIFQDSGTVVPVNFAALLPASNDQTTALMNATFTQYLSAKFGLFGGKISTVDGGGEFAGNYRTQFQNTALTFPMILTLVPLTAFGGGIVVVPWEAVVLTAMVLDPNGTPTNNDLSEAFRDGFTVVGNGQVTIKPFGLMGHQSVGYTWSDQPRLSLIQDPSNIARSLLSQRFPRLGNPGPILAQILARFFPQLLLPVRPANKENSSWSVTYGFDQYLWQPAGDPSRGLGIFFTFGASDGNPNPIKYSYSMGISGTGLVPGRPRDTLGVGWARSDFSGDFVPLLRQRLHLGLNHEDAIEMYYNASVTRWLNATLDLQVVEPGLKKTLDSSGNLKDVNTAVVVGLRLYARF